jgi:hypothetical protein
MESIKVFKNPAIIKLCVFMLAMSFFYRFYYFGTAPFLRSIGFTSRTIMPAMSLGQIPEVFAMGILGVLLLRFGSKKIILIGLLLDIFRYASASLGGPYWLIIMGLAVHGLAYTFIYTTTSIYLDRFCDEASRTGVHQLFGMITAGLGNVAGNLFCGMVMDACTSKDALVNYHHFWMVPTGGLFMVLLLTLLVSGRADKKTVLIS